MFRLVSRGSIVIAAVCISLTLVVIQGVRNDDVYLYGQLGDASEQSQYVHKVHNGTTVHLLGPGGYVEGLEVWNSLIQKYHINIKVDGSVYSAHAVMALLGDTIEITGPGVFMFHHHSGYRSELAQCRMQSNFDECFRKLIAKPDVFDYYIHNYMLKILTPLEMNSVFLGEDVYIDNKEMKTRLCNHPDFKSKTVGCPKSNK